MDKTRSLSEEERAQYKEQIESLNVKLLIAVAALKELRHPVVKELE